MFSLNEKVVYPGHGVAKVNRIFSRNVAGKSMNFFELTFLNKDMTILVPLSNADSVGIRQLSSRETIDRMLALLASGKEPVVNESLSTNWNKRNKGYQEKIRRGRLHEISEIYRDLRYIESQKELSFGEKSLLHKTEDLLVEEMALVFNIKKDEAKKELRSCITFIPLKVGTSSQKNV